MKILGIDPGLHGAWALLSERSIIRVDHFPILGSGKHKRLNGGELSDIWRDLGISLVVIEAVHSMPRDGVSVAFKFGYSCGQVLGVVEGLKLPVTFVPPQTWKKHFKLTANKEDARMKAIETFPHSREAFARVKDQGRAEAALIALWGSIASPASEPPAPIPRKTLAR